MTELDKNQPAKILSEVWGTQLDLPDPWRHLGPNPLLEFLRILTDSPKTDPKPQNQEPQEGP